jgi:hypothetical protein
MEAQIHEEEHEVQQPMLQLELKQDMSDLDIEAHLEEIMDQVDLPSIESFFLILLVNLVLIVSPP